MSTAEPTGPPVAHFRNYMASLLKLDNYEFGTYMRIMQEELPT